MSEIKIISHKNPDTDSVCGSLVLQDYLSQLWKKSTPIKLGKLNKETEFLLKKLWIKEPETVTELEEWAKIALVDHNEQSQSIENLWKYEIEYVVDHHKFWGFTTSDPLFIRVEKLCSTNSVLFKMYKEAGFEISKQIATLMIAAILSDSLNFRSATTTKEDVAICKELNQIAQIENLDAFAMKMFDEKSDLSDFSIEEIINSDYKEFKMNWTKTGIWTLETTNPHFALWKKEELLEWLKKIKSETWLDFILLSVVDILNEKNTSLVLDWFETEVIEKVFWTKVENNLADLWKRLSRKKQVAPDLTNYFS